VAVTLEAARLKLAERCQLQPADAYGVAVVHLGGRPSASAPWFSLELGLA
jgi:hypothetical protein